MLTCLDGKADQRLANGLLLESRAKLKSQSASDFFVFLQHIAGTLVHFLQTDIN